jgi:hypothetical protein
VSKPIDEMFLKANAASLRALAGGTQQILKINYEVLVMLLGYGSRIIIKKPIRELAQNHLLLKWCLKQPKKQG